MPFVGFNYPEVEEVAEKWADLGYLKKKIGKEKFRTETSEDNHFMYWTNGRKITKKKNWKPPTGTVSITFDDWMKGAVLNQNKTLGNTYNSYLLLKKIKSPFAFFLNIHILINGFTCQEKEPINISA